MGAHCVQIFFVISGYLGCSYFFRCSDSTVIEYYKKRSLRILPIYYAAILAAMIYVELFTQGFNKDVFYLGWARYYLGLNTLLPSADFWHWKRVFYLHPTQLPCWKSSPRLCHNERATGRWQSLALHARRLRVSMGA